MSEEWHPNLNGKLKPRHATVDCNKKVWWLCKKGHVWQARVCDRSEGGDCPYCSGACVTPNESDIASLRINKTAKEHSELNDDLKLIVTTANNKVWLNCEKGHQWQASVSHISEGSDCPFCSSTYLIQNESDVATL